MAPPNSVNFQTNLHPPQDRSENYPFFQQNKNKKQTSYQMDYLSSDDDFLQPDIFAPYNQEYRGQGIQKPHTYNRIFFSTTNRYTKPTNQFNNKTQLIHNLFSQFSNKTQ